MPLREQIEALAAREDNVFSCEDRAVFDELKRALNRGEVRAAEKSGDGKWIVNSWVKQGILVGFRMGAIVDMSVGESFKFFDKDTYPGRPTQIEENVRIGKNCQLYPLVFVGRDCEMGAILCARCN